MTQKTINFAIALFLGACLVALRPIYSALGSVKIVFFMGCILFLAKGFVQFALEKRGGPIAYIKTLITRLKSYINTQARDYNNIVWYKKPKYCLLLAMFLFHTLAGIYYGLPSMMDILFQCLYFAPILLMMIIGGAFPFIVMLFLYILFFAATMLPVFHGFPISPVVMIYKVWFILFMMGMITICLIIEVKRNNHISIWKRILSLLLVFVLCVIYWSGAFYTQDKIETQVKNRTFVEDCIKHNTKADIEPADLEQFCQDALKQRQ
ncbi:MAG: hypothetical protein IJ276_03110 [Alphaproteobacteria bacterium]|nr:hypothetical protein [Alphaproteobacteria bacterium]